jgi:hypothetical protein
MQWLTADQTFELPQWLIPCQSNEHLMGTVVSMLRRLRDGHSSSWPARSRLSSLLCLPGPSNYFLHQST